MKFSLFPFSKPTKFFVSNALILFSLLETVLCYLLGTILLTSIYFHSYEITTYFNAIQYC